MNHENLKNLLQSTRNERRGGAPREDWVTQSRDILLMQVKNTTDANDRPKMLAKLHHLFGIFVPVDATFVAVRTVGVFLLMIAAVLGGGLASAQLYNNSMPGEMLYNVKLAVEKTQLVLSPNDEYRLSLHAEFADRRVNELAFLSESAGFNKELVLDTLVAFEQDVVALRGSLEQMQAEDPIAAVEVAKLLERKMTLYHSLLQKAAINLPPDVRLAVNATRNRIDDLAISAMAIVVQGHIQGDTRASRTVIVNKFEDRIKQAESSLDTVIAEQNIYEETAPAIRAKTAIAEAKILLEEENYQAAMAKIVEVAELTKEAEEDAAQNEAEEEAVETEASNQEVEGEQNVEPQTEETEEQKEPNEEPIETEEVSAE
ncbi:MAG: DUF5667 domain-containing protein [Patescibacteria group bacterium]